MVYYSYKSLKTMEIFMKKSKKILVTSLATATLGLISFADTTGFFPFSVQHVSAQEKDASKNGKIVKENTTSASNQKHQRKNLLRNQKHQRKNLLRNQKYQQKNPLRNRKYQRKILLKNLKIQLLKRISLNLQLSLVG